jgi:hypothetical protein
MRQPDNMRGILNPPGDFPLAASMIAHLERDIREISESILSRPLDREQYLAKMGELAAARRLHGQLVEIYKRGTT